MQSLLTACRFQSHRQHVAERFAVRLADLQIIYR